MAREKLLSNAGFFLGVAGIIFAAIPFLLSSSVQLYNIILPIILGIAGLILVLKIKKVLNDDVVKVGLVVNPLAIVLAIVQLVVYLTK